MESISNNDAMCIVDQIEDIIVAMEDRLNMVLLPHEVQTGLGATAIVPTPNSTLVTRLKFVRDSAMRLKNRIDV